MVKTTVYLDADVAVSLKYLARTQKRPQAEIIREALKTYTKRSRKGLIPGIGKYNSGRSDISDRTEEILEDAARRKSWR